MTTVLSKKNLFYPANCKIEKCVDQFKISLPFNDTWKIVNKLSWDDIITSVFFILNFVILTLSTIYRVDQFTKKLDEKRKKEIVLSQKILRIILGVVNILIALYHIYIYYYIVEYSIQNRIFIAGTQILTGILFILFSSYSLVKEDNLNIQS